MAPKQSPLPHVTCLMQTSVDGKIMIDRWPDPDAAEGEFERIHALHRADAWLCGRVTMAYFARTQPKPQRPPDRPLPVRNYDDFVAAAGSKSYAVAVDAAGKLWWKSNVVNGDRLIVILTRRVPLAYLADLRAKGISYVVAGRRKIDFAQAFRRLREHFGIKQLLLEGGGGINASLLHSGLINELSLLLSPVIDGDAATKGIFQTDSKRKGLRARGLRLLKVVRRPAGILWLRYRVLR